ncbi:ATP-binding protein [Archangium lipolyticum]|uniref:ATP-binding protein n=1 Tax=Archangium lipolyticum TaxID=2970465 RepID=UPI002149AD5A|nr:ATP-binding protein [Archangium lipolyticum]
MPLVPGETRRRSHNWLTPLLDGFLSEHLRRAPPSELLRNRVLVGTSVFALVQTLLYLVSEPFRPAHVPMMAVSLCYATVLVLARRVTSLLLPGTILCVTAAVCLVSTTFISGTLLGGTHATSMLLPVFAVYMVGPRLGLLITAFASICVGLGHPLYRTYFGGDLTPLSPEDFHNAHISAALALMGAWLLGTLHSTSRDAAQAELERTLRSLRESEGKLLSVIESTDDLVCSVDTQKRIITVNAALRRTYLAHYGHELLCGQDFFANMSPGFHERWSPRLDKALSGEHVRLEDEYEVRDGVLVLDVSLSPIVGAEGRVTGLTLSARDVTERKAAEARLRDMHRTLVDVSRQAGMAEVATGVLHNVGNTLNSVNTSVGLMKDQLRSSRMSGLVKAAELLREHAQELGTFLTADPRGQRLPSYLIAVTKEMEKERETLLREVSDLSESVDHIKSIVCMQQKHARAAGVVERLPVPQLIEEALRLQAGSFESEGIRIERDYADVPPILVDRHKLLQILINLLSNARHALLESSTPDKRLVIHVRLDARERWLLIEVTDTGVGIAPEHLPRLFSQGFTTRETGHGFGLHSSALAATEMNGRLSCTSAGRGLGATFTLGLPVEESPEGRLSGGRPRGR